MIKQQPVTKALKEWICDGFTRHAIAMTGIDGKFESIAFVAMEGKVLTGALVVEVFWDALHVKSLYVDDLYRGKGLAKELMERAFAFGREQKCPFAFIETMSFQALGFYQKLGFELEFTRSGYSHGTSFHYLRKGLERVY